MIRIAVFLFVIVALRLLIFYLFPPPVERATTNQETIFTGLKESVEEVYYRYLSPDQAGLLTGIVFGENLDKQEAEVFKKTGLLHVVAASGMNVSMLTSFILASAVVFFKRKQAVVLTMLAVIFYTALADFQPSIVRAGLMGLIALSAGLLGRQNTSLFALALTAVIMILIDPEIITSLSFILSFSATLGIILIDPLFKLVSAKPLSEDFRTTLSAQMATTPILLFFFGTYTLISIPANLLVLWTVPPLMALGFIGAIFSFLTPFLAAPFILLCMPLLAYFLWVAEFLSRFDLSLEVATLPWAFTIGYYLILFAVILRLYKVKKIQT